MFYGTISFAIHQASNMLQRQQQLDLINEQYKAYANEVINVFDRYIYLLYTSKTLIKGILLINKSVGECNTVDKSRP